MTDQGIEHVEKCIGELEKITVVSRKYAPLSLSTKHRGAYTQDVTISLAITSSLPGMRSEEAGHFREVAGVSIVDAGSPCSL